MHNGGYSRVVTQSAGFGVPGRWLVMLAGGMPR
jgi:hypothetical protein